jgi:copper resistance protein C
MVARSDLGFVVGEIRIALDRAEPTHALRVMKGAPRAKERWYWKMGRDTRIDTFWFWAAITVVCGIALLAPTAALAHAVLVHSQPEANSTVSGPEVAILLKYSSRIDLEHSTLTLLAPDGKVEKVVIDGEPSPGSLSAKLKGLVKGAYVLRWQVLATDGHVTRGKVPFQVQ